MTATQWLHTICGLALLTLVGCTGDTANTAASDGALITGEWTLTIDTPRGLQNPVVTVSETDGALSGTYESFRGPLDISRVTVDGNKFSFPLTITVPIGAIEVNYEGTINGDQMTGLVKNPRGEVPFTGTRTGR